MVKILPLYSVFWISILVEFISIASLRAIGIDWDYHVDSVTYVEKSALIAKIIISSGNIFLALNNSYYLLVNFLQSNPHYIIIFNSIIFSLTNLFLVLILRPYRHKFYNTFEYLVLFNPYRVYLGTTLLKDTLLIFLIVISYYFYHLTKHSSRFKSNNANLIGKFLTLITSIISIFVAGRSIVYLFLLPRILDNPKKIKGIFTVLIFFILMNSIIFHYINMDIFSSFVNASQTNMNFRDYGKIPNFASFGAFGSILRIIIWPIFYITGFFIFLSPSLELLLIAIGIVLVFLNLQKLKLLPLCTGSFLNLTFFAGVTSGFLSFGRYVLPVWVLSIIIVYIINSPKYKII